MNGKSAYPGIQNYKEEIMEDIIKVESGRLVMDVALGEGTLSESKKSTTFFTTHGNIDLPGGYKLGVNLYRRVAK